MEFKAIALDMDGTLLNEFNELPDDLGDFLQEVRGQGVKLFIASGRSAIEIKEVLPDDFEFDGMVSANGMGVYAAGEKLVQHRIHPVVVEEAIAAARAMNIYYEVHPLEEGRFALAEDKEMLQEETSGEKPDTLLDNEWHSRAEAVAETITWKDTLDTEDIIKVYFFSQSQTLLADWIEKLEEMKADHPFSTSSSSSHNVEIMVAGVDKGTGIDLLLEANDLDGEDLLAIGDGENDIPMFNLAGLAVAMENAEHVVKSSADEMTDLPYDEGGLLDYLEQHFDV